jgi:hypothetical protein
MLENAFNCRLVARAWRHCWRGHVTPPVSSKVFTALPGNSFTAGSVRLSSARFGSARHGTEKHRFVYDCVIAERVTLLQSLYDVNTPH